MTLEQFISNNRGINDGGDLPQQLLSNVYHDITHREIKTGTEFDDLAEAELMDWLRQVSVVNCLLSDPRLPLLMISPRPSSWIGCARLVALMAPDDP